MNTDFVKAFVLNKYKNLLPERAVTELIPNEPKTVHVYDSKVSPFDGDGWQSRKMGGYRREMGGNVRVMGGLLGRWVA